MPNIDAELSIVQLTDLHLYSTTNGTLFGVNTDYSFRAVLEYALKHSAPDILCATGDLVHDEGVDGYIRLASIFLQCAMPVFCIPGNHDDSAAINLYLNRDQVKAIEHIVLKNWLLIFLDTSEPGEVAGYLSLERLARLQAILTEYPNLPVLILAHHPPVEIASVWMDQINLTNSAEFFAVIDEFPNIKGIICGHIHQEFDYMRGRVRYLGTPSTCVQFEPRSDTFSLDLQDPGYRWLKLRADGTIITGVIRVPNLHIKADINAPGY